MPEQQFLGPDRLSVVRLQKDASWVQVGLLLSGEFTGGPIDRILRGADITIKGADELSASYTRANWISAVASGALYAFRTLGLPRQHVELAQLTGELKAEEMQAIANGTAHAIARLADKTLPPIDTDGWGVEVQSSSMASAAEDGSKVLAENGHHLEDKKGS
jgi:hypothetical protein